MSYSHGPIYSASIRSHRVNRSEPFCKCEFPTFLRQQNSKKLKKCECGEDASDTMEWNWDAATAHPETHINQSEVIFHPIYSQGTSIIRGDKPLEYGKHHYWEIKVTSCLSGTDIMFGIGTNDIDFLSYRYKFVSALGLDDQSWGYSYRGCVQNNGRLKYYGKKYAQGCIVGVYLDLFRGVLEFYLNRKSQGRAYTNIQVDSKKNLYAMACSTSAKSSIKLINAASFNDNLKFNCMKVITKYPKLMEKLNAIPGLKMFCKDLWFLQFEEPKKTDEFEKNNLLLEDEAIMCGLKKKKFESIVETVAGISDEMTSSSTSAASSSSSEMGIYDHMNIIKFPKFDASTSGSSCDGSEFSEITNEFFCNHF